MQKTTNYIPGKYLDIGYIFFHIQSTAKVCVEPFCPKPFFGVTCLWSFAVKPHPSNVKVVVLKDYHFPSRGWQNFRSMLRAIEASLKLIGSCAVRERGCGYLTIVCQLPCSSTADWGMLLQNVISSRDGPYKSKETRCEMKACKKTTLHLQKGHSRCRVVFCVLLSHALLLYSFQFHP